MGGSTKTYDSTPSDIKGLRSAGADWAMQGGQGRAQIQGGYGPAGVVPSGGVDLTGGPGGFWSMPGSPGVNQVPLPPPVQRNPETSNPYTGAGLDPNAIAADPSGYADWQRRATAAGYGGYPPAPPATGPGNNTSVAPPNNPNPAQALLPQPGENLTQWMTRIGSQGGLGPQGGATSPTQFSGIYAGNPSLVNPALANVNYAGNASPVTYGQAPDVAVAGRDQVRDLSDPNGQFWNLITQFTGPGGNVNLGHIGTQSIDQLGGATSAFFNNMKNQYQPYFTQARNEAIAAGKEGLGSLSGSSASNLLGSAVNRTLGAEQANLAELAKWGIGQENDRQLQLAGINTNRDIAGAQINNQRGLSGLDAAVRLGTSDQSADLGYLDYARNILQGNQAASQQTNIAQGDANLAQSLQNQNLLQQVLSQIAGNNMQIGTTNAGILNQTANNDADRFLQYLIGMSTTGVGAPTTVRTPGFLESILPVAGQVGAAYVGKRA